MPAPLSTTNLLQASQILECPHNLSANSKLSPVCTNSQGSRSKPCPDLTAKHSGAYGVEHHKGLPSLLICMGLGEKQEATYSCCSTSTTLSRENAQRQTGVVTARASRTEVMSSTCMLTKVGFVSTRQCLIRYSRVQMIHTLLNSLLVQSQSAAAVVRDVFKVLNKPGRSRLWVGFAGRGAQRGAG